MCRWSCVPVWCVGTSYASASARDGILSAQRTGAHRTDYIATMSKTTINSTVVPLPSLRCSLKLICVYMRPAQCQTIVLTFQWSDIVQVSYGHIRFETQWRDGRGTGNFPDLKLAMVLLIATYKVRIILSTYLVPLDLLFYLMYDYYASLMQVSDSFEMKMIPCDSVWMRNLFPNHSESSPFECATESFGMNSRY